MIGVRVKQARPAEEVQEYPLPVAEDYGRIVSRADRVAEVIDQHLDYEEEFQRTEMTPRLLCREQKVNLASDTLAVIGGS